MKVLLSTLSLDAERGSGTAQRTRHLARNLAASGTTCAVATMEDGDLADDLRGVGIPVYASGHVRIPYHLPLLNPRRLAQLVRNADAVHVLGYWNLLSVTVAWLARCYGRPYLLSAAGEFAALQRPGPVKRAFHHMFGRGMIAGAHGVIAITQLEKRQIIEWLGVAADRIIVLPNGVDIDESLPADDPDNQRRSILFIGRLAPIKGPDLLIDAFAAVAAQFPDIDLTMAGPDGGLRRELEQRCKVLGIAERVTFSGFVDETGRAAAYRNALLVVVPSRDEAMSLVALEAGAHGRPILVTDRCGLDEISEIGGGRVVAANAEALAVGLTDVLSDRQRLSHMGVTMRDHVRARYTWARVVQELNCYLQDVLTD